MLKTLIRVSVLAVMIVSALLASPTISYQTKDIKASEKKPAVSKQKNEPNTFVVTIKAKKDNRSKRLETFFKSKGSPLTPYAKEFVKIADKHGLDWRFMPAIAGVESTFGLYIPYGSYNPYGWNNGSYSFKSWTAATDHVAGQIKSRWGSMETITPWKIGSYYAASPTWASKVSNYMNTIGQY